MHGCEVGRRTPHPPTLGYPLLAWSDRESLFCLGSGAGAAAICLHRIGKLLPDGGACILARCCDARIACSRRYARSRLASLLSCPLTSLARARLKVSDGIGVPRDYDWLERQVSQDATRRFVPSLAIQLSHDLRCLRSCCMIAQRRMCIHSMRARAGTRQHMVACVCVHCGRSRAAALLLCGFASSATRPSNCARSATACDTRERCCRGRSDALLSTRAPACMNAI